MKKILLATTMLVGTAGFAAAEVAISGYAELGIKQGSGATDGAEFHTDVDVTFKMSGETDSGLSFGVSVDLDEGGALLGNTTGNNGTAVFVEGAFGKFTMGDTDGALDWAVADADALTSIADDHTGHLYFFGANGLDGSHDDQVARYEYSFGDFAAAISYEQANDNTAGTLQDDNVAIGATYKMDMGGTALSFGIGYQQGSNDSGADANYSNGDVIGISVKAELAGGFTAALGYTSTDYDALDVTGAASDEVDFDHTGLGLTYTTGALSLHANVGMFDPAVGASDETYGLAVNYDLGGGAVVMAGYGSDADAATAGNQSTYSIGLGLSF
jgi:outer membrane protein OmpU